MKLKQWLCLLLAAVLLLSVTGCALTEQTAGETLHSFPTVEASQTTPSQPAAGETTQTQLAATTQDTQQPELQTEETTQDTQQPELLPEDGVYDDKDNVALYIHQYGHLPQNYITKKEAQKLGWPGGSLEPYAPGKCIGGSHFGNYEGVLPEGSYTECDIDTMYADSRGAKRIVFSDDGRIYYTADHYETFELLYGGD